MLAGFGDYPTLVNRASSRQAPSCNLPSFLVASALPARFNELRLGGIFQVTGRRLIDAAVSFCA